MSRLAVALVSGAVACALLAACGDAEESSLCTVYAHYLAVVQPVLDADPTAATAADATDAVTDVLAAVQQLRQASDGRYAQAVDDLETVVDDLRRTLESAPADAEYAVWQPLVDDTIEDALRAHDRVVELIDPVCVPDPELVG